jgi:endonuclease-3
MAADRAAQMALLTARWPGHGFECASHDPWAVLVTALLQAATSWQRAEQAAARLLEQWSGPERLADLHPSELEAWLGRLPRRREKARAVVEAGRFIRDRHGGVVPVASEELLQLPGVRRQVAGLVQAQAHGVPAVVADEHVQRVLSRLGWIAEEDALAAEVALQQELPPQAWAETSARLSQLGKVHCRPKIPRCAACPLAADCPSMTD